jgi:AbrB family looped-hinge helix DNA binding protein
MRVSIDKAGRVVLPKPLRDALGLQPGCALEVTPVDGRVLLEPIPVPMRLVRRGRSVVARPARPLPALTVAQVRATLEAGRR